MSGPCNPTAEHMPKPDARGRQILLSKTSSRLALTMLTCSFAPNKPKLLPLMAASCVYSSTGTCAGTLRSLFTVVLRGLRSFIMRTAGSGLIPLRVLQLDKHAHKFTGDLDELFQAFQHTWTQRWCRHDKVPNSQWDDILAFASRVVRPAPCKLVEVDHSLLGEEIRCKRRRTSKGLDGVSILDLKAAPASLRTNICLFYKDATETGEWAYSQMIAGRIANVAKNSAPTTPDDFRLITVFGLCYRLWTSIQCRSLLADLDCILPAGLFGGSL